MRNLSGGVCLDVQLGVLDVSFIAFLQNLFYQVRPARARLETGGASAEFIIEEPFKQIRRAGLCAVRFGPVISFFKLPIGSS